MNIIKQVIGIDVSKDTLVVEFGTIDTTQHQQFSHPITVENQLEGFKKLLHYAKEKRQSTKLPVYFAMEATGVYYENLAYFLTKKKLNVFVVLPNKTKNYSKTLENKSKTDKLDAHMITQFALERQLQVWNPPSEINKSLKALTREYQGIKKIETQLKNQLHAKNNSYKPLKESVRRYKKSLAEFKVQLKEIQLQIKELLKNDKSGIKERIDKLLKIEGVGLMTAVSVVAETNGFALFENTKQLASYAGLDVVYNESGLKKHKTSISKRGNKYLRRALYMPALSACRCNPRMKQLYIRLIIKVKEKKIGLIAVARKMLILMYTIYKKNLDYISNYNPATQKKHTVCFE